MKLVVVTHPRSCASFFINQFRRSSHLEVVENSHGELIPPGHRSSTRRLLDLNENGCETWDHDEEYAERFFERNPNGAFKILSHTHKISFTRGLAARPDTTIVKVLRKDIASTIASSIACNVAQRDVEYNPWSFPARENPLRYADIGNFSWTSGNRMSYIDHGMWLIVKGHAHAASVEGMTIWTEELNPEWTNPELEEKFGFTFDFSGYKQPSHYSEVFPYDYEKYEQDLYDILGPVQGLDMTNVSP